MHKLLLLALGLAHAKTEYRSALQIGRERAAAWYYGPLGLQDIQATIAFIGDSTHRNQLQFLCDVLGTAPRAIAKPAPPAVPASNSPLRTVPSARDMRRPSRARASGPPSPPPFPD